MRDAMMGTEAAMASDNVLAPPSSSEDCTKSRQRARTRSARHRGQVT